MSYIDTIICKDNNYKITIPITTTKEIMEELISKTDLSEIKCPVPNMKIINLSKIEINIKNKVHYGINFTVVNISQILIDYKKTTEDEFYINFLDKKGEPNNKCIITDELIPYNLLYSNEKIFLKG